MASIWPPACLRSTVVPVVDVLKEVLPSARNLRINLSAGGLWLLALVLVVHPRVVDLAGEPQASPSLHRLWQAVADLGSISPGILPLIGILAAAYVLGSISDAALGSLSRRWAIFVVQLHRGVGKRLPWIEEGAYWAGDRRASTRINFLTTVLGREWADEHVQLDDAESRRSGRKQARLEVQEKVRRARDELQNDPDLQAALAERWDEADYRLSLVFPVMAVVVAAALSFSVAAGVIAVAAGVAGCALIAASANHLVESANDDLGRWYSERHPGEKLPGKDGSSE